MAKIEVEPLAFSNTHFLLFEIFPNTILRKTRTTTMQEENDSGADEVIFDKHVGLDIIKVDEDEKVCSQNILEMIDASEEEELCHKVPYRKKWY